MRLRSYGFPCYSAVLCMKYSSFRVFVCVRQGNESERKTGWTRFVSYSQFHIYIYVALSVCVCVVFALHWVKRNKIIPIYVYVLPTAAATAVLDIA